MLDKINKNLKNTKIKTEEKKIKIELIEEGWITETFLILNLIKKNKYCDIKDIFQVYKEDKMIIKELIENREILINADYVNFIKIIKNETKRDDIGSGKISWNKINEIEIRLNRKLKENKDWGFNEQYEKILLEKIIEFNIS
jgi:hypothetical protein